MDGVFELVVQTVRPGLGILMTDLVAEAHQFARHAERLVLPSLYHTKGALYCTILLYCRHPVVEIMRDKSIVPMQFRDRNAKEQHYDDIRERTQLLEGRGS